MRSKRRSLENTLCLDFPSFTGPYQSGYNPERAFHPDLDKDKIIPLYERIAEVVSQTVQEIKPTPHQIILRMIRRDYDHVKYLDSVANVGFGAGFFWVHDFINKRLKDYFYECCGCGDLLPERRPNTPGFDYCLDIYFRKRKEKSQHRKP